VGCAEADLPRAALAERTLADGFGIRCCSTFRGRAEQEGSTKSTELSNAPLPLPPPIVRETAGLCLQRLDRPAEGALPY